MWTLSLGHVNKTWFSCQIYLFDFSDNFFSTFEIWLFSFCPSYLVGPKSQLMAQSNHTRCNIHHHKGWNTSLKNFHGKLWCGHKRPLLPYRNQSHQFLLVPNLKRKSIHNTEIIFGAKIKRVKNLYSFRGKNSNFELN